MFKVDEIWLTRDGNKVKVTRPDIDSNWYPIEVQNIVTKEVYTVSKTGRWEIYYDCEEDKNLVERIN